jgi:hypothetical protein
LSDRAHNARNLSLEILGQQLTLRFLFNVLPAFCCYIALLLFFRETYAFRLELRALSRRQVAALLDGYAHADDVSG